MIRHARTRRPALRARARQPGRSGRRGRPRAGPAPGAPRGAALPPRPARRAAPPSPLLHVSLSHPLRVCTAPTRGRGRVQLGWPDMRLPILYTMSWPERVPCSEATWPRLDFAKCAQLTFRPPDREKYPAMDLAYAAGRRAPARSFPRGSRAEAPCTGRLLLLRGKRLQLLGGEVPLPGGCGVKTASCLAVPLSLGGARGARRALLSLLDTCNLRAAWRSTMRPAAPRHYQASARRERCRQPSCQPPAGQTRLRARPERRRARAQGGRHDDGGHECREREGGGDLSGRAHWLPGHRAARVRLLRGAPAGAACAPCCVPCAGRLPGTTPAGAQARQTAQRADCDVTGCSAGAHFFCVTGGRSPSCPAVHSSCA